MKAGATGIFERDSWRLTASDEGLTREMTEAVIARALDAASGRLGGPGRRSRHASTWQTRVGAPAGMEIFIKLIDAPRGLATFKQMIRGGRSEHVARVTQALNDSGFLAPPILLRGVERHRGRELIVAPRAEGDGPLRTIVALRSGALERKRSVLRALGAEIARLHRCGFVHGDLTPFNIFFVRGEPPHFVLIDHERTRRTFGIGGRRRMLRNLVQLGRFELPEISATDRMRVMCAYSARLEGAERKALTRRVNRMLRLRISRDGVARVVDLDTWVRSRS